MANTSKVIWLNNGYTFWDQNLLHDLLKEYSGDRVVFVIPGNNIDVDEVNMEMARYPRVTVIVTSDEENNFPADQLYHPDMRVYVNYPDRNKHWDVDNYLPIGYPQTTKEYVKSNGMSAKSLDWFFAGQDTHQSRHDCIQQLSRIPNGVLVATEGFSQGLEYKEYMQYMCRAKVVPCPAGYTSPDSFRLYEALEAGCIPIPENTAFWKMLFGEVPFPVVDDWEELPMLIQHYKDRPDVANRCQAWWQLKKRELKWKI